MAEEEYFKCFAWALPMAFREPLNACRFEQGDILYNTTKAYEGTWADALKHLSFSLQIKSPARGSTTKIEKDADFIFSENWRQPVVLELTEYPSKKIRSITTTQGRLYTALWKDNLSILNSEMPEPPVPLLARELLKELSLNAGVIFQKVPHDCADPVIFLMPFDETRSILRTKRQKVASCLNQEFQMHFRLVNPEKLHLANACYYVPTLQIACFIIKTSEINKVYSCLKKALYVPARIKKTDAERFRLEAHGCLHPKIEQLTKESS